MATEGEEKAITDFITRNKLEEWTNTWDHEHVGDWRGKYDVYSTPTIYLLDEKKIIRGKRLDHSNIPGLVDMLEKQNKGKKCDQESQNPKINTHNMRKLVLTCIASGICAMSGYAQTLFTYGHNSVDKDDFLRVYKKNSINKKPDMSDTALRSYLDLYALFRMKVAEADKQKLDTVAAIDHELDTYRKQLSKNYLTDDQVTNKLIHEAYDRMKENIRVEHILISCPPGSDTTIAYNKIDSIYHLIESKKVDFETMAKQFSDDKGTKDNGGDIGYITALQTVYPFENVAYNTPLGSVSKPFHTQFGYHILKVTEKRPDRGQVKVAQVMIHASKSKGEAGYEIARKRADSVEVMLKNGATFDAMVKNYSDDKFTVKTMTVY